MRARGSFALEVYHGPVAYFVGEIGMKFRVNMVHTPAKFLAKLTDFWGVRTGVKATGGFDIKR